jgi:hypothetical protein
MNWYTIAQIVQPEMAEPHPEWAYHGTDVSLKRTIARSGLVSQGDGIWFTGTIAEAESYAREGLMVRFPWPKTYEKRIRHVNAYTTTETIPPQQIYFRKDQWTTEAETNNWIPIYKKIPMAA